MRINSSHTLPRITLSPRKIYPQAENNTVMKESSRPGIPGIETEHTQVINLTGLAEEHLQPLQALAEKEQLVISFRPVEQVATGLISAGYPTKDFSIKGKSSNWGPMAGFIPVDQFYSKLCGQKHKTEIMNKKVAQCIEQGHAGTQHLRLSESRINELVATGLLIRHQPDAQGNIILDAVSPHGHHHPFTAKPEPDGQFLIYNTKKEMPVIVLSAPDINMPLTADYDLMIVAPRTEDFGGQDIAQNPDVSADAFAEKRPYLLRRGSTTETIHRELLRREDPKLGNSTPRIAALIQQINTALNRTKGTEVVHHSMDATNPGSDMSTNFPVTFFLPESVAGLPQILLAQDIEGLRFIIHTLECNGFMVPHNPLWSDDFSSLRRESFEATRRLFNTL
ncbi:anthrax toxin-like adenylyl cyclase domain-containing protein [Morganella psychrotolerans]|uniref:anthrax toxin-like adenylyl cyclase domain-containing protein n=1 Tax=Morganella psychrotolerans TaxID=368603 RepID=UPI0039B0F2BA